jgi:protein SCO1/2
VRRRVATAGLQLLAVGLLLVLTAGCTAPADDGATLQGRLDAGGYVGGTSLPEPYVLPDETLTDTAGNAYNLVSSPSKPVTLMFFGYTHCPDVCVGVLSDVATALQRIPAASRDQIQVLFVTTDPERDTGAVIQRYLEQFDPTFIGLTGSPTAISTVADQVGVEIEGRNPLPDGGYEVGHSAQVIGFDRRHRGVVLWTPSTAIGDLAADLTLLVARQQ